jgi:DNA-binding MarR family transcriptional regulator
MQASTAEDLDRFEAAVRLFIQTMKRPQSWSLITQKASVDIDRPAATILMLLNAHTGQRCRLHDLAENLNIEAPSVTRKVQQLEQAGFIVRQQDSKDKRAYDLRVTKQGQAVAEKIRSAQRQIMTNALDSWTVDQRTTLVSLFERFSQDIAMLYRIKPASPTNT